MPPVHREPTVARTDRPYEVAAKYPGQSLWRAVVAMILSVCGGLALVYLVVYTVGGVDPLEAGWLTLVALVMALVWLAGFVFRHRTGALKVQRADRERRGF
ncbi:MAG: hypothetical protein ACR2LY_04905 [Thermoleophilaceae bacterium]